MRASYSLSGQGAGRGKVNDMHVLDELPGSKTLTW